MGRSLALVSLVAALAAGAYLINAQLESAGPAAGGTGSRAVEQGREAAAAVALTQAANALEQFRAASGTYAGADVSAFTGVTLARADAASYCLQSGALHQAGPGGAPAPGPC